MQSLLLWFAAFVACASAIVSVPPGYENHPKILLSKRVRQPRDLTWQRRAGPGRIYGTLGNTDYSVYGRGGYQQDIFNDRRGRLQGQVYGTREISDYGSSSRLGGQLDWSNDNAKASLDVHKEIGGGSGMKLSGDGVWNLDRNTRLSAGGNLQKNFGHDKPEFGVEAKIEHDF